MILEYVLAKLVLPEVGDMATKENVLCAVCCGGDGVASIWTVGAIKSLSLTLSLSLSLSLSHTHTHTHTNHPPPPSPLFPNNMQDRPAFFATLAGSIFGAQANVGALLRFRQRNGRACLAHFRLRGVMVEELQAGVGALTIQVRVGVDVGRVGGWVVGGGTGWEFVGHSGSLGSNMCPLPYARPASICHAYNIPRPRLNDVLICTHFHGTTHTNTPGAALLRPLCGQGASLPPLLLLPLPPRPARRRGQAPCRRRHRRSLGR
jgi:hypothetical protein